jgi:predicted lipoprotein with Yx(FWY)xxD motif
MSKLNTAWRPIAAAACFSLLAACSQHQLFSSQPDIIIDQPAGQSFVAVQTTAGKVLAAPNGMTLYIYDKDTEGVSTCYGDCAQYWPPMLGGPTSVEAGFLTLTTRTDGTKQWTANKKPLYIFIQDKKPGDVKGDNFHNVWHVVRVQ